MCRSSRSRTKNTAWDFAPQHRTAGIKQEGSTLHRGAFGSLIVPSEDDNADDVDEAAAALLAMSCPQPLPKALPVTSSHPLEEQEIFCCLDGENWSRVNGGKPHTLARQLHDTQTQAGKCCFDEQQECLSLYLKPGRSVLESKKGELDILPGVIVREVRGPCHLMQSTFACLQEARWSPPASPREHSFARKRAGSGPKPPDSSFQFPAVPMEVRHLTSGTLNSQITIFLI